MTPDISLIIPAFDEAAAIGPTLERAGKVIRGFGPASEIVVVQGDTTEEGGYRAAVRSLGRPRRPTAIFAYNDVTAVGVLDAALELGIRVPGGLSLVGYDNTSLAALGHIGLTTIDQPRLAMGRTAADLLLQRLERRRSARRTVVMSPTLLIRATTAPPEGVRPITTSRRKVALR